MSACSLFCSFMGWFKLSLFNFFGDCGGLIVLMQRVVRHPFHLFYIDEKFSLSSALQWFNYSSFFLFLPWEWFYDTKNCPEAGLQLKSLLSHTRDVIMITMITMKGAVHDFLQPLHPELSPTYTLK